MSGWSVRERFGLQAFLVCGEFMSLLGCVVAFCGLVQRTVVANGQVSVALTETALSKDRHEQGDWTENEVECAPLSCDADICRIEGCHDGLG